VPPLSARRADVPELVGFYLSYFAAKLKRPPLALAPEALAALQAYPWPGNVRELRNVLERAAILTPPGQPVEVAGLPLEVQLAAAPGPASLALEDERSLRNAEMQHIRRVLREVGSNKAEAARVLGIAHTTLYRKIQEYGL